MPPNGLELPRTYLAIEFNLSKNSAVILFLENGYIETAINYKETFIYNQNS
jgi:hypothetical protein